MNSLTAKLEIEASPVFRVERGRVVAEHPNCRAVLPPLDIPPSRWNRSLNPSGLGVAASDIRAGQPVEISSRLSGARDMSPEVAFIRTAGNHARERERTPEAYPPGSFAEAFANVGAAMQNVVESISRAFLDLGATLGRLMGAGISDPKKNGQERITGNFTGTLDNSAGSDYLYHVPGTAVHEPVNERNRPMPRRINPQSCACGCGEMTRSGEWVRGHHTRRRWQLVKAVAQATERTPVAGAGRMGGDAAKAELQARGWTLPSNYRHFGVELELIAANIAQVEAALRQARVSFSTGGYHARGAAGQWMITADGSLRPNPAQIGRGMRMAFEVVSPPLRGRKGIAEMRRVVAALNAAGCEVNKTCGSHAHHSAADFDLGSVKTLVKNYASLQVAIDAVLAPSRRSTEAPTYCKGIDRWFLADVEAADSVSRLARLDRYRVVNLQSLASYGTLEMRQHQGTLDADKLEMWVLFGQGMMRAARKGLSVLATRNLAEAAIELGMSEAVSAYLDSRARAFARAS